MKFLSFLTSVTLLTSVAFWTGLALDLGAVSLFAVATSVWILLLVVGDYYPSHRLLPAAPAVGARRRRAKYALPMAA